MKMSILCYHLFLIFSLYKTSQSFKEWSLADLRVDDEVRRFVTITKYLGFYLDCTWSSDAELKSGTYAV